MEVEEREEDDGEEEEGSPPGGDSGSSRYLLLPSHSSTWRRDFVSIIIPAHNAERWLHETMELIVA